MIGRVRLKIRTVTCAVAAVLIAGAASVAPASAATQDEQFIAVVEALGISIGEGVDAPAIGRGVCATLTSDISANTNPVSSVRSIVTTLENEGLTDSQAVGVMRYAVMIYCPQWGSFIGR